MEKHICLVSFEIILFFFICFMLCSMAIQAFRPPPTVGLGMGSKGKKKKEKNEKYYNYTESLPN